MRLELVDSQWKPNKEDIKTIQSKRCDTLFYKTDALSL